MKFREMIEGLQILAKYQEHGLDAHLNGADHDVVWAAAAAIEELDEYSEPMVDEDGEEVWSDTRISAEDAARLVELGWFVDGDVEAWTHYC